jgi:hypothetical protein
LDAFRFCFDVYFFLLPRAIVDSVSSFPFIETIFTPGLDLAFFPENRGKRASDSLGDRIISYEYNLTIIQRVAWFGRGTKGINVPADFVAGDNRVRHDSSNGAREQ